MLMIPEQWRTLSCNKFKSGRKNHATRIGFTLEERRSLEDVEQGRQTTQA